MTPLVKNTSWTGKLAGAGIGLLAGGPAGLLVGFFAGHLIDRVSSKPKTLEQPNFRQNHLRSLFLIAGHLAKSDGRVSEQEINSVEQLIRFLGLKKESREQAIKFFSAGKKSSYTPQADIQLLGATLSEKDKETTLLFLLKLSYADGALAVEESKILATVRQVFNVSQVKYTWLSQQARVASQWSNNRESHDGFGAGSNSSYQTRSPFRRPASQQLKEAYQLLEVGTQASDREIKQSYRRLMSKYHPDKLLAKEASDQEINRAKEKVQEIQEAYNRVRESR